MISSWSYAWDYAAFMLVTLGLSTIWFCFGKQSRAWVCLVAAACVAIAVLADRTNTAERELNTRRLASFVLEQKAMRVIYPQPPVVAVEAPCGTSP